MPVPGARNKTKSIHVLMSFSHLLTCLCSSSASCKLSGILDPRDTGEQARTLALGELVFWGGRGSSRQ